MSQQWSFVVKLDAVRTRLNYVEGNADLSNVKKEQINGSVNDSLFFCFCFDGRCESLPLRPHVRASGEYVMCSERGLAFTYNITANSALDLYKTLQERFVTCQIRCIAGAKNEFTQDKSTEGCNSMDQSNMLESRAPKENSIVHFLQCSNDTIFNVGHCIASASLNLLELLLSKDTFFSFNQEKKLVCSDEKDRVLFVDDLTNPRKGSDESACSELFSSDFSVDKSDIFRDTVVVKMAMEEKTYIEAVFTELKLLRPFISSAGTYVPTIVETLEKDYNENKRTKISACYGPAWQMLSEFPEEIKLPPNSGSSGMSNITASVDGRTFSTINCNSPVTRSLWKEMEGSNREIAFVTDDVAALWFLKGTFSPMVVHSTLSRFISKFKIGVMLEREIEVVSEGSGKFSSEASSNCTEQYVSNTTDSRNTEDIAKLTSNKIAYFEIDFNAFNNKEIPLLDSFLLPFDVTDESTGLNLKGVISLFSLPCFVRKAEFLQKQMSNFRRYRANLHSSREISFFSTPIIQGPHESKLAETTKSILSQESTALSAIEEEAAASLPIEEPLKDVTDDTPMAALSGTHDSETSCVHKSQHTLVFEDKGSQDPQPPLTQPSHLSPRTPLDCSENSPPTGPAVLEQDPLPKTAVPSYSTVWYDEIAEQQRKASLQKEMLFVSGSGLQEDTHGYQNPFIATTPRDTHSEKGIESYNFGRSFPFSDSSRSSSPTYRNSVTNDMMFTPDRHSRVSSPTSGFPTPPIVPSPPPRRELNPTLDNPMEAVGNGEDALYALSTDQRCASSGPVRKLGVKVESVYKSLLGAIEDSANESNLKPLERSSFRMSAFTDTDNSRRTRQTCSFISSEQEEGEESHADQLSHTLSRGNHHSTASVDCTQPNSRNGTKDLSDNITNFLSPINRETPDRTARTYVATATAEVEEEEPEPREPLEAKQRPFVRSSLVRGNVPTATNAVKNSVLDETCFDSPNFLYSARTSPAGLTSGSPSPLQPSDDHSSFSHLQSSSRSVNKGFHKFFFYNHKLHPGSREEQSRSRETFSNAQCEKIGHVHQGEHVYAYSASKHEIRAKLIDRAKSLPVRQAGGGQNGRIKTASLGRNASSVPLNPQSGIFFLPSAVFQSGRKKIASYDSTTPLELDLRFQTRSHDTSASPDVLLKEEVNAETTDRGTNFKVQNVKNLRDSVFIKAIKDSDEKMVQHLLFYHRKLVYNNSSVLHLACSASEPRVGIIKALLDVRPELVKGIDKKNCSTALHSLCNAKYHSTIDVDAVRTLLLSGIAASVKNLEGYTALHCCALFPFELLKRLSSSNTCSYDQIAFDEGSVIRVVEEVMDTLLVVGNVDINELTARQETVLHLVCKQVPSKVTDKSFIVEAMTLKLVRFFCSRGVNVEIQTPYNNHGKVVLLSAAAMAQYTGQTQAATFLEGVLISSSS